MDDGLGFSIFVLLVLFVLACIGGWIFMLLWNWIAPLFWIGAPVLTFWQGVGVVVLLKIIGTLLSPSKD